MSNRYENLFRSLRERGEGAFVPFLMLGDPTPEDTLDIVPVSYTHLTLPTID